MKFYVYALSAALSLLLNPESKAQESDSLLNRAGFFFDNEEYQMAIIKVSQYIQHFPANSRAYRLRGNCYRETGQYRLAINDFRSSLSISPKDPYIIYNLGVCYDKLPDADSAIFYYREFTSLKPDDPEGYFRLCSIFMYAHPEWPDSAVIYASKAVNSDPKNGLNYNFLAMAFYAADENQKALETAQQGIRMDSSLSVLYKTAGISCFFLKDYSSAIRYFEKAYRLNPDDIVSLDFQIQTVLLQNTDPGKISLRKGGQPVLNGVNSGNIAKVARKNAAKQQYEYSALLEKFKSEPLKMGLDEFFMLYYGYSSQPGYSPDSDPFAEKARQTADVEEVLRKDPSYFPLYLNLADFYIDLGNTNKYFENRFKYFGFTESIKASGDGLSPETAYIVTNARHEYNIMISLGYGIKSQTRQKIRDHFYDILEGADLNNRETTVYFNVDLAAGSGEIKRK